MIMPSVLMFTGSYHCLNLVCVTTHPPYPFFSLSHHVLVAQYGNAGPELARLLLTHHDSHRLVSPYR